MAMRDPHSHADDSQPSTKHLELELDIDFTQRCVLGTATLLLDRAAGGQLDLDTKGLSISKIEDGRGNRLAFDLDTPDPIKGSRLIVHTTSDRVAITYRTAPDAIALQWLEPSQTMGKKHPYVFTQCQAIHARSVIPCQDTPRVRSTYDCTLRVPDALTPVMAAAAIDRRRFRMPQPIPSYLFAFAVGDLSSKELGPRSRIWCEPAGLDAAAWEFAEVDRVLLLAEELFGPYPWDRYDLLVMPPSFPYGGMENPRLTFLTPTVIAKDRSLVNVVAHELAHSWTGNLVTNADMNHFWLNEGFTVYAERRILEKLEGLEAKGLHAALGRISLEKDIERLAKKDLALTRLENDLTGTDPDEVYSQVPYEKGYLLLERIEEAVGRPRFDRFLASYIDTFRFRSITTRDFLQFLDRELPEARRSVDLDAWIHGTGIPSDAPVAKSARLDRVQSLVERWRSGARPHEEELRKLDANEWQLFLNRLDKAQSIEDCAWLDQTFALARSHNYEIRVGWLTIAATSGYAPAYSAIEETLREVGRMKYLRPLYKGLIDQGPEGKAVAKRAFEGAQHGYHPVARAMVEGMLR
jgi:leukotriene A-4 hydrolase/aminopeptidase